jgi:hypothetical protein
LIEAIDSIKALDPACGSGAFPMGVLHKLVYILSRLDPGNHRWKQKQLDKANEMSDTTVREKVIEDIEQAFSENELDYGRKLYLIENCIYGVDIQPIAVQISKLRFFISLIVDQKIDDDQDNCGIRPLPNLETKFVAANTLIGIDKPLQMVLHNVEIDELEAELADLRKKHFAARTPQTKRKYRDEDERIRERLAVLLKQDGFPRETTEKLAQWNPYNQNESAEFFDSEWMFSISKGFDIVIGNPPYGIVYDVRNKTLYENLFPAFRRNNDIYVAFYQRSLKLLRDKIGELTFITPNTFLNGDYFKQLRLAIAQQTVIQEITDYKDALVFADPTVFVCIFMCKKTIPMFPYSFTIHTYNRNNDNFVSNVKEIFAISDKELRPQNQIVSKFSDNPTFVPLENLFYVKDVGFNYWTEGKGKKRDGDSIGDRVLYYGNQQSSYDIPFLKGRDISRWCHNKPSNFLRHNYEDYLDDEIDTFRFSSEFLELKPKIIYRQTANTIIASIDYNGLYLDKTVHLIVPKTNWKNYPPLFLLGLLNSHFFAYLYSYLSQETEGRAFAQVKTTYIKKLPLPTKMGQSQIWIESIVKEILIQKEKSPLADVSEFEEQINKLVFELYGLDELETTTIEQFYDSRQ